MAEETKKEKNTAKIDTAKQAKLKKQAEVEDQDEKLKQEDPQELRSKLSNKNSDYVFRLEKELQKQGSMSRDDAVQMTNSLLSEIIIAQRHGQPANGLYLASPAIKAEQMLHPERKPTPTPFWQLAVDGSLLYLAIFFGMFGILALFQTGKQEYNSQWGVLTLATVSILMGVTMVKYNDWMIPKKGSRRPWVKAFLSILIIAAVLFVLIWILSIPAMQVINPVLPGIADIIIAAVAFGVRYLFRKHYHIVGSTFAPRPQSK
ncbi:DUF1129 family protein [Lactobacillus kefiranofaciens]|nr:DUF1129 family protein [Lactobacillus kefiranofaciens]